MADNLFSGAKGMVSQQIQDALGLVSEQLGDQSSSGRKRLTYRQQLDRYLKMDDNDFEELRRRVGDDQFLLYRQRMKQIGEANTR